MRQTHFSMLPLQAFQPRCGRFGMTLEGGAVNFVEDVFEGVGNVIGDVVDFAGDVVEGVVEGVQDVGRDIDDFVNDEIPGGWGTVATVAALTVGVPGFPGAEGAAAAGATEGAALGIEGFGAAADMVGGSLAGTYVPGIEGFGAAADMVGGSLAGTYVPGIEGFADVADIVGQGASNIDLTAIPGPENVFEYGYYDVIDVPPAPVIDRSIPFSQTAYDQFAGIPGLVRGVGDLVGAGIETITQNPRDTLRVINTVNQLTAEPPTRPIGQTRFTGTSLLNPLGSGTPVAGGLPGSLEATELAAAPVNFIPPSPMNLLQLRQLYPQLNTVDPKLLQLLTGRSAQTSPSYYTYGAGLSSTADSASDAIPSGRTNLSLNPTGGLPTAGFPSIAADRLGTARSAMPNYMQGSPLMQTGFDLLGGRSNLGFAHGGSTHQPEFITGATGHYVQGKGDGQSDDIPAMLADGEYVFDADTVAALGNGSNKAGAAVLDRMRQNIRKHKRAAADKDIPPKAKSPLAYMKG